MLHYSDNFLNKQMMEAEFVNLLPDLKMVEACLNI